MYTKLYSDILDSSLWSEDSDTRIVWITLLAMADMDGMVRASAPGVARRAAVSQAKAEEALAKFASPDPYSRSLSNEGRRIERVDGGYLILGYVERRNTSDKTRERELTRERVRRHRAKKAAHRACNEPVTASNGSSLQAEADTEPNSAPRAREGVGAKEPPAGLADAEAPPEEREAVAALVAKTFGGSPPRSVVEGWLRDHKPEWVRAAVFEAAHCRARNPHRYIAAILDAWRRDGYPRDGPKAAARETFVERMARERREREERERKGGAH